MNPLTRMPAPGNPSVAAALLALALCTAAPAALAGLTQISNAPLASSTSAQVKPNVMLIMDTSGSMDSEYLPDSISNNKTSVGFKNSTCNKMYYNPSITYTVPKKSDGSNFATASFTAAYTNGYSNYPNTPSSSQVNLSSAFQAYSSETGQGAYYYTYTGSQTLTPDGTACNTTDSNTSSTTNNITSSGTGGGTWAKIRVSSTSGTAGTDERTNFANWYQYYRTRLMMVKGTVSRSFNQLTDSYRVGFITIAPTNGVSGTIGTSQFTPISDFDTTQRTTWFTNLFRQSSHDSTPLREALARVGRYYAGKSDGINTGMSVDPVQYSCQQNFAIMTTDGYWNTGDEVQGPVQMDGTTNVGQQDADLSITPRPMWDGGSSITTSTGKSNTYRYTSCSQYQRRDQQIQRRRIQWETRTQQIQQRTQQRQQRTQQLQRQTEQLQSSTDQLQADTEQLTQRTEQHRATQNITTRSIGYIVFSPTTTNNGQTSTFTSITFNGVNKLGSTVSSNNSTSLQARALALANGVVSAGLTGYTVTAQNCPGAASPAGCNANSAYITITASTTSDTSPLNVGGTSRLNFTVTNMGGGGTQTGVTNNVPSCAIGSVVNANVTTQTTACPADSDSGFVPLPATSCTGTGGAFNASGTRISCSSTTTGLQNLAATSCATSSSYNGSGRRIIACNTVIGTFADLAATSCTPSGFNASGARTNCQTVVASPYANLAASSCSTTAFNSSGQRFVCQTTDTGFVNITSCTASTPTGGFTSAGTQITCQTTDTGFVSASSCTASSASGQTITCQTTDTGFVTSGACTASSSGGQTVTCNVASDTGWVDRSSCTASDNNPYTQYCQTTDSGWYNVSACTASVNNGLTITCQTITGGTSIQYQTTTSVTTTNLNTGAVTGPTNTTGSWTNYDGVCYFGSAPALPDPGVPTGTQQPLPTSPCTAWPCVTTSTSGGSTNSLADVAQYYYATDLRPTMDNNVPAGGTGNEDDKATWQHMTTFTLGLGLAGQLTYRSDYKTATTGDFQNIRDGISNWPVPSADQPSAVDDLWHAAVNGRGQFFSASDPDSVVDGLTTALAGVNARVSSAAAAATSNLEPVAGDNFAYTAKYKTVEWVGELEAHEIDLSTGEVKSATTWSAQSKLDAKVGNLCDNRTIYLFRSGATSNRVNFTWNTQGCDTSMAATGAADTGLNATEQAYFGSSQLQLLTQYTTMTDGSGTPASVNQKGQAFGDKLVNFVRGQRAYEGYDTNTYSYYRTRTHVLGDIVNAQPVYVKTPFASYTDTGYTSFKTSGTAATRAPMVYVAANDGMLHAFYAGSSTSDPLGGQERWAFIPSIVLPNLYKLADTNYANNHAYSVDGTPTVGDFYDTSASAWKTVLVAGLRAGGKGYYALDVTDPSSPKGLWEFKWSSTCYDAADNTTWYADCHVGYSYNNPMVTKLADGTWVVIVTSGYNNVNSPIKTGDGLGYLYVLRAYDGKILYKIATTAGDSTTPSGLNYINGMTDSGLVNNTTLRVYGVDLLGNTWRFDINDTHLPAGREAALIGTAKTSGGTAQPISTKPEVALKGSDVFIMVGTGKMLGSSDLTDTLQQSVYGFVDTLGAGPVYTDLRGSLKPLAMTQVGTGSSATRTVSCTGNTAQCNVAAGWVIDLKDIGERVSVDMRLQLGTLVFGSNVPESSACTIGGYSWLNFVNYSTGTEVASSTGGAISQKLSDSLVVGLNIVRLPDGRTVVITTTSDAKQTTIGAPFDTPAPTGKRISWREIPQ